MTQIWSNYIAGLTNDQLRVGVDQQVVGHVILQAQVKALDIDITGLTDDEIRIQLKTASHAKQIATLQARAKASDEAYDIGRQGSIFEK